MNSFPVTKAALLVAGIVQAIFAGLDEAVSFVPELIWIFLLFVAVAESFWSLEHFKHWDPRRKLVACAIIFVVFCVGSYLPLKKLYYKSEEDLRVSFRIDQESPNNFNITYLFLNKGKNSALINTVGLFEVVAKRKNDDASNNIELCDGASPMTLTMLLMSPMGKGSQIGGDSLRSAVYDANKIVVDGAQRQSNDPISVEAGRTRIVSAVFNVSPDHAKDFNVIALCPLVMSLDIKSRSGASICKGLAWTAMGDGSVTNISGEQFRILPYDPARTCAAAD